MMGEEDQDGSIVGLSVCGRKIFRADLLSFKIHTSPYLLLLLLSFVYYQR